jgi:hypothetical protein
VSKTLSQTGHENQAGHGRRPVPTEKRQGTGQAVVSSDTQTSLVTGVCLMKEEEMKGKGKND